MDPVPDDFRELSYLKLKDDRQLWVRFEKYLIDAGYELVLPPGRARPGDEFISQNGRWNTVTEKSHPHDLNDTHYLVRRKTEHKRMMEFFFGSRRVEKR